MLTRVYIDNFRCFVNFEFRPQAKQLIVGVNGTGKSSFREVLGKLRDFVVARPRYRVDELFTRADRTLWQTLPQQTFELEVSGNGGTYLYTLRVDVPEDQPSSRVLKEALDFNGKPLLSFDGEQVHLFDDEHVETASYPFDADRSALAVPGSKKSRSKLVWFKTWLDHLYCLKINPYNMGAEAREEDDYPEDNLSNFAAWYRHNLQEDTRSGLDLQRSLREVITGFDSLDLKEAGRARVLQVNFQGPSGRQRSSPRKGFSLDLDRLSDGERALVALYTLLHYAVRPGACLCLDEPENFLALAEIQPWLFQFLDRVEDTGAQTILISHHPELINLLAPESGVVFSRDDLTPVRVERYRPDALGKLSPSEQIARGWERG